MSLQLYSILHRIPCRVPQITLPIAPMHRTRFQQRTNIPCWRHSSISLFCRDRRFIIRGQNSNEAQMKPTGPSLHRAPFLLVHYSHKIWWVHFKTPKSCLNALILGLSCCIFPMGRQRSTTPSLMVSPFRVALATSQAIAVVMVWILSIWGTLAIHFNSSPHQLLVALHRLDSDKFWPF